MTEETDIRIITDTNGIQFALPSTEYDVFMTLIRSYNTIRQEAYICEANHEHWLERYEESEALCDRLEQQLDGYGVRQEDVPDDVLEEYRSADEFRQLDMRQALITGATKTGINFQLEATKQKIDNLLSPFAVQDNLD